MLIFESRHKAKNGRLFPVEIIINFVEACDQEYISGFVCDISERKAREEEIKKRQELLAEAENLANLGSFEWNIISNKVTWSDGLYQIYGLKPQEFGASFEAFLSYVHPDNREKIRATIEAAYRNGTPFEMEEQIIRRDGEKRILFSRGEVIKDKNGSPVKLIGVCQDITERRRSREQEIRQRLLEADNARKTQELEEARRLQLSMLPKSIPSIPEVEIAVYMKTAAEVGGDYYDFMLSDDGTLTFAIGDATGHGLQAGMMVTATKSLFNALAHKPNIIRILKEISKALKLMGFGKMFMGLTVARFKNHVMHLASAGIPYTLIYHADAGRVDEVVLKGLPLGKFPDFPYTEKKCVLSKGDTVLFMSDGLPDRFNRQGESMGEEQIKSLFAKVGKEHPEQIIEHLEKAGETWANGQPQHDDITFVVMRMK